MTRKKKGQEKESYTKKINKTQEVKRKRNKEI